MKKKIANIVHNLNPGGTERLVADMSTTLSRDFDISVICLDEPGLWADSVREKGIPVHAFYRQPGLDLRLPIKLASFARKNKIDLFHAHQCTPWFCAGLARIFCPWVKLLFEEHGRLYPEIINRKRILFNKFLLQHLTTLAVAVSKDVKKRLAVYEGVNLAQISVVYNGANPTDKMERCQIKILREQFGFNEHEMVVGTVGRIDPIKNLPLFIRGFKKIKIEVPDLRGIIIGDGPLFPEIAEMLRTLGLEKDIVLTGYRSDAATLMNLMDIFILVSFSEGTSMALLESMSLGIPSIVTDVGGNPEIVINGETGWIIPSDDQDAFDKALHGAILDVDKRSEMGDAAKRLFRDKFEFSRMIEQYRIIYDELMENGA
jgi:glycosyltransferase involved in cell wall biosynthesis